MVLLCLTACRAKDGVPKPGSDRYATFISMFYKGLAALQVGDDVRAEDSLAQATQLAPGEPAAWVDWGVLALRQRSYDAAADRLNRAHNLDPQSDQVEYLLGLLEGDRGNSAAAVGHLQEAVKLNPRNLRATYELASEIEREGDAASDARFEQLMQQVLTAEPGNLAALLELSRIAAKRGEVDTLRKAVAQIAQQQKDWPAGVVQQLKQLQDTAAGPDPRAAATRSIFLRNVLMQVPQFRNDLSDLKPQPGEGAQPMLRLQRVQNPPARPAAADLAISFEIEPSNTAAKGSWAGALPLNGEDAPVLATADGKQLHLASGATLPFPGGREDKPPLPEGVLPIDFNYDFKNDLVLAGIGGVRFFRQDNPASFTDVTAATKLPQTVIDGSYTGAWALDIEADGDLDVLLGSATGQPTVLRNNGDGTFTVLHPFAGISGVQQMVWIDVNGDGNPDAAIVDGAGRLHLFLNQRSGNFAETALPSMQPVKAITSADVGASGSLELVAVQANGSVVRIDPGADANDWSTKQIAGINGPATLLAGSVRMYAADIDNNGAVDLVVAPLGPTAAGSIALLQSEGGVFTALPRAAGPAQVFALADLKNDGRLALVGLDSNGSLAIAENRGTKNYQWQTIRPRARVSTGDQRINSFGIGGEIEIRAGLLLQKQPITSPALHFGLGEQKQADVARILWPNGSVRAEFDLKADQQIVTEQRLKGSCPFLFAWNGHRMQFVKDSVPWGSAIGLRINALGAARIAATEEWYKIGRDQLQPHNGYYDLRVTGELWETYYYDAMHLMTIDHPAGTEIYTDERFDVPPVKLAVTATEEPQPVARAVDDTGHDATAVLSSLDGAYLDNFGRGQYQGVTRDHYVEIDLPESARTHGPLWLIAKGWLHPSDSSINVAISQGSTEKPRWLSLEVPDGRGGWHVAKPNLGFPAGRNKTCLIDLQGVFPAKVPLRMRLRTNLEVYWDQIQWAHGEPDTQLKIQRLASASADLHYRGFSTIHQASDSSPELPDYNQLSGTSQQWRDLEGYYTRFGDVRELLADTDDRYVIMNAGDELSMQFAAPPPPPAGWVRDYVIAGDGWIKDGDYNSTYSQTVLPYPYHARTDYNSPPGHLEDDWVVRHHADDWRNYQTRYITPDTFQNALRVRPAQ